ncbi:hypothetical protein LTR84_012095 [Exophiala bonariae]|uniref:C2H2-type domain-containing protein n=1 Tax=Exophiala bonariae TaxID=1690606 RepID=A0AAV9NFL0_9EURO|nr:hypothetical protein LTR84_012095 [Exophiala bonariae]
MAAQVLPSPSSQFPPPQMSYGDDMLTAFPSRWDSTSFLSTTDFPSDLEDMSTVHASYHQDPLHQQLLMVSPQTVTSEMAYRRRSSHSPQAVLGMVPSRDRTPIRHSRPSVSRNRSHSRGDMLLAYAGDPSQLQPSQALPSMAAVTSHPEASMPHMYNMHQYGISPSMAGYPLQSGYFPGSVPPHTGQHPGDYPMGHNQQDMQAYYGVGRTSPHGSAMSLSAPDSPSSLYVSGQASPNQQALPSIGMAMHHFPPVPLTLESSPAEIEIMPSRPKPQCWDHGCNGRQFSTFSNLLRHQREKSGSAMKATCPHCGTEFTRTTARNGHMSGGKCKGRAHAEASNRAAEEEED